MRASHCLLVGDYIFSGLPSAHIDIVPSATEQHISAHTGPSVGRRLQAWFLEAGFIQKNKFSIVDTSTPFDPVDFIWDVQGQKMPESCTHIFVAAGMVDITMAFAKLSSSPIAVSKEIIAICNKLIENILLLCQRLQHKFPSAKITLTTLLTPKVNGWHKKMYSMLGTTYINNKIIGIAKQNEFDLLILHKICHSKYHISYSAVEMRGGIKRVYTHPTGAGCQKIKEQVIRCIQCEMNFEYSFEEKPLGLKKPLLL